MKKIIWAFIATWMCAACTSMTDRADKLYENEAYEEAAGLYEQILQKNPADDDVRVSLNKTRLKIIDRKLIQVRKFRLAGDQWESTNQLLQLIQDEDHWQHYPKGPVAFTQGEESDYSSRFIKKQIDLSIDQALPLKALSYLRTYAPIFSLVKDPELDHLEDRINQSGEKQCLRLSGEARGDHFFYDQFAKKFCDFWSVNLKNKKAKRSVLPDFLFKGLQFDYAVAGLPSDQMPFLNDEFNKAFQKSPWYSPDSQQVLQMKMSGAFKHDEKSKAVTRSHSYEVKIPYVETHVEKKVPPPKDGVGQSLAVLGAIASIASLGSDTYTTRSDNSDGTETISEHKVRYEPRVFEYAATEYDQDFSLLVNAETSVNKNHFGFDFHDERQNQTFEHHNNLPDIGLTPEVPKIWTERDFFTGESQKINEQLVSKLKDLWKDQFCRVSISDRNMRDYSEAVLRCLYADLNPTPAFVDDWFVKNLGLKMSEAKKRMEIGFVR